MGGMALPIPSPRAAFDLTRSAVGLPARAFRVLDDIEVLLKRVDGVVDRIEGTLDRVGRIAGDAEDTVARAKTVSLAAAKRVEEAAKVSAAAGIVVAESQKIAEGAGSLVAESRRVAGAAEEVVGKAASTSVRAAELLSAYEPALHRGAPMANRFVEQLSPDEVEAAIKLVDELPKLTRHLHSDILPILATLDRVGPDIHDLLEVTRDLKLAVAGIPGLKMLMRRGEDKLQDE
jgi:hypothetical protein